MLVPESVVYLERDELVARYVGGANFDSGTGQINGSAFERTPKDHDGVSFTRRGLLSYDQEEDRQEIRRIMASRLNLGKTAIFAEIQVGLALDTIEEFEQDVYFIENALKEDGDKLANPAHALLIGFPFRGEQIGSLKSEVAGDRLRQCVVGTFPAIMPQDVA